MVAADDGDIGVDPCRGAPAKTADRTRPCRNPAAVRPVSLDRRRRRRQGWAKLFTPDGEYSQEGGSNKAKGREQLTELGQSPSASAPGGQDCVLFSNVRFEPSPEGARGGAYS